MEELEVFNGIDGSTGRYLFSPTDREVLEGVRKPALDPARLREYRWWIERHGIDDPDRAPVQGVDPKRLDKAGWAVIFGSDVTDTDKEALRPLLNRRKSQADLFFKEYVYQGQQTKQEFLLSQGAGPGPADPRKVPYYVLLVGNPRGIDFRFQYELDVQYAVGRLHFEKSEDYAHYAKSVIDAETRPRRPKRLTFFGVRNPDDRATRRTSDELIKPLARALQGDKEHGWPVHLHLEEQAYKKDLAPLLGGAETPALLFTACHGMGFPMENELQLRHQGALLCQDWPGPEQWQQRIPPDSYFSLDDVPAEADLLGLIAFHYACYSAGTPDHSDFEHPTLGDRITIAKEPFLARLAQRLLSHPRGGALAILGHVDRAWTTSFSWTDTRVNVQEQEAEAPKAEEGARNVQIEVFESVLKAMMDGHPIGSAMEYINQRHAELSVELSGMWADREYQLSPSKSLFSRMWRANNDARNFVVLGDPAVCLGGTR